MDVNNQYIYVFCDGGCRGNQFKKNIGGYGVLIKFHDFAYEFYGFRKNTTNNIMELMSCIKALESIKNKDISVIVTMDSKYVIEGISYWVDYWISNDWKSLKGSIIKNKVLWEKLYFLKKQFKDITFIQCKGHSDNEGNIRADQLVNIAMNEGG